LLEIRRYRSSDRDTVKQLHEQGLDQLGVKVGGGRREIRGLEVVDYERGIGCS
jgi:hypothetical protein